MRTKFSAIVLGIFVAHQSINALAQNDAPPMPPPPPGYTGPIFQRPAQTQIQPAAPDPEQEQTRRLMDQINKGTYKPNIPVPNRASTAAELKACNDMVNRQPQPKAAWMKQCTENFKKYPAPGNYCFSGTDGTNPSFPCLNGCYQPTQYKMCVEDVIQCVPQSTTTQGQREAGYCKWPQ